MSELVSKDAGTYQASNVDFMLNQTEVKLPAEELDMDSEKKKMFDKEKREHPTFTDEQVNRIVEDHFKKEGKCDYMNCTCPQLPIEIKSIVENGKELRTVRFVGVTDGASNGQKFHPDYMSKIAEKANARISSWKSRLGGKPIPIYDRSSHKPDTHGDIVGWVETIDLKTIDNEKRKNIKYYEVTAKTFDPGFNLRLDYGLIDGWSIGFWNRKYMVDEKTNIRVTTDADIDHWVASLNPADDMARTLEVSAKSLEENPEVETPEKKKEENIMEKVEDKKEPETAAPAPPVEEKKTDVQAKEAELIEKTKKLEEKEIDLELKSLTLEQKITPNQAEKLKPSLIGLTKAQRDGIYAAFDKPVVVPEAKTQQAPATVEKPGVETKEEKKTEETTPDLVTKTKEILAGIPDYKSIGARFGSPKTRTLLRGKTKVPYDSK